MQIELSVNELIFICDALEDYMRCEEGLAVSLVIGLVENLRSNIPQDK